MLRNLPQWISFGVVNPGATSAGHAASLLVAGRWLHIFFLFDPSHSFFLAHETPHHFPYHLIGGSQPLIGMRPWWAGGLPPPAATCRHPRLMLPATIFAAKLCSNSSIPCVQLPHGVQMPMVALGSWRGSYKDFSRDMSHGITVTLKWVCLKIVYP